MRRSAHLALYLTACSVSVAQSRWTEPQFLAAVEQRSPALAVVRASIAVARAEAAGRGLYPNPSVSYSREGAGFTEFFQAEQPLAISGRLRLLRQAGAAQIGVAEAEAALAQWQIRTDARNVFGNALLARARVEIVEASTSDIRDVVRILRAREREGEGSRYDRLRAERELAERESETGVARAALAIADAELRSFLPPEVAQVAIDGRLATASPVLTYEEALNIAREARPELRVARADLERFRLERSAAARLRYPDPIISAGVKRADIGSRNAAGAVVSISVPLPVFNTGATEVQRFTAEAQRVQARLAAIERRISSEVEGSYRAAGLQQQALAAYEATVPPGADELVKIARTAYDEGEIGILELLDAFRSAHSSRQRIVQMQASAREAWIRLEAAVGSEIVK